MCQQGKSLLNKILISYLVCLLSVHADSKRALVIPNKIHSIMDNYCLSCHDEDTQKGDINLDQFDSLKLESRLELLNKVQEQLYFKEMPPKNKKKQPKEVDRNVLIKWVSSELKQFNASRLEEKLKKPEFGNYVDHEKLFSGKYKDLPAYTENRRWLINEYIFNDKMNRLLNHNGRRTIDGTNTKVTGDNGVTLGTQFGGGGLRQSIVNPFLLPKNIGVRYYDYETLTGGHLLTMISNAKKVSKHMTSENIMKTHYPVMLNIMEKELQLRETLRTRSQFLNQFIEPVLKGIYQEKHEALLPPVQRVKVEEPPRHTNGKGEDIKKTNIGLLVRYQPDDLKAVYMGIDQYKKNNVTIEQLIERCENEWFIRGIHEKRIRMRISMIKVFYKHWDMKLILADIKKRNYQSAPYEPLNASEMSIIKKVILTYRKKGDTYQQIINKCLKHWEDSFKNKLAQSKSLSNQVVHNLIVELFEKILERKPTKLEEKEYLSLFHTYVKQQGNQKAIAKLIETLILSTEFVYRSEFGTSKADKHGRKMMSPREASYALAYALTDSSPDQELRQAALNGKLNSRKDYEREIKRMLKRRDIFYVIDESVQKNGFNSSITNSPIRKLRFFRDFFGYTKAMTLFKDDARFGAGRYDSVKGRLVDEADMLVDHILQNDKNVFEELLGTEKFYVYHTGNNEDMKEASQRLRKIYDYFKQHDWKTLLKNNSINTGISSKK